MKQGVPDGPGGAVPVHALVLPEAVVLNGHQGLDEVVGQIGVLDELPVAAAGVRVVVKEGLEDHLIAVFVRGVDGGGQGHGHLLVGDLPQGGDQGGVDVGHEDLEEDGHSQHADDAQGEQDQNDPADEAADGEGLLFLLAGAPAVSAAVGGVGAICTIHRWTYLLFREYPPQGGDGQSRPAEAAGQMEGELMSSISMMPIYSISWLVNLEKMEKTAKSFKVLNRTTKLFIEYKKEVQKSSNCHMERLLQFPRKTVTLYLMKRERPLGTPVRRDWL